jgi:hypothetical protein
MFVVTDLFLKEEKKTPRRKHVRAGVGRRNWNA